jgi:LysR family glycine cleavage system transcriptional activator
LDTYGVQNVHPETGLQFDSYDHALSTAVQGLGVALAMQPYVDRELSSGMLVEVFDGLRARAAGDWYLVCRRDKVNEPKVSIFREWLIQELKQDPSVAPLMTRALAEVE